MKLPAFLSLLALVLLEAGTASLPKERKRRDEMHGEGDSYVVLGNYVLGPDNYDEVIDLSDYEGLMDYGDQLPEVRARQQTGGVPYKTLSTGGLAPCRCFKPPPLSPGGGNSGPSLRTCHLDDTKKQDNKRSSFLLVCSKLSGTPRP